jgi:hypothetical protein
VSVKTRSWLLAIATLLSPAVALARVPTCVHVAGPGDTRALERLVVSEIDRHTTHVHVERGCEAELTVELIVIDPKMGGGRYLTGGLDGEVPARVEVGNAGLSSAVEELLTVVLHNDPRRLRGPDEERADWFTRGVRALRVSGSTYFGFEAYEIGALVDGKPQMLPGLSAFVRREIGPAHIGVRIGGAHAFENRHELTLTTQILVELEAALFSSPSANTALFAAMTVGLEVQQFEGPTAEAGKSSEATASSSGLSLGARAGIELFRVTRTRASLFAQVHAPTFMSSDGERGVVDQWTPSVGLGAAVAF